MIESLSMDNLTRGEKAVVREVTSPGSIRRRLMDIGLVEGTVVECIGKSPFGDPSAFQIKGAVIALRREDANTIKIESL